MAMIAARRWGRASFWLFCTLQKKLVLVKASPGLYSIHASSLFYLNLGNFNGVGKQR